MTTEITSIIRDYVNPLVGLIGFVLCLASFITFRNSAFNEKFFSHIKFEAFFMLTSSFFVMVGFKYSDNDKPIAYIIYKESIVNYLKSICEMLALYNNILANVTFLLFIFNRKCCLKSTPNLCKRHSALILTLLLSVVFTVLFSYQLFRYDYDSLKNSTSLSLKLVTDQSVFYLELTAVTIRDGIGMFLVFISNIVLCIQVIKCRRFI